MLKTNQYKNKQPHMPVMSREILDVLNPKKGESYLDLTAGYGGHAHLIIERTGPELAVLVDQDVEAIAWLKNKFPGKTPSVLHNNFYTASQQLSAEGKKFDIILADLGVSSPHLNNASRGFSLSKDGPLDMRMDQNQTLKASDILNFYSEEKLVQLLKTYGEEPKARAIARLIIANRPLSTTKQLAAIASLVWPGHSRVHPATRLFQAIRIAVNDELGQLEKALPYWIKLLHPGGRLAVISFHSLEDRIVKQTLNEAAYGYEAELKLLLKHPITPNAEEIVNNPRSRSAKLRAAVKINKKGEAKDANTGKKPF